MPGIETRSLCALFALSFSPGLYWEKGGAPGVVVLQYCDGKCWFLCGHLPALGQVHRRLFLSQHSAVLALLWSRWLCCNGFACMSSAGICWQRFITRPVLLVLFCQSFQPCMASRGCTPSSGQASLAKAQDSKSVAGTAQGLCCDTPSMQIPAESPF